ncbi:hypothetical protein TNCV_1043681 [Trichonephila clavipes]|nr:hypothetical protein TNCV_1043681 [Trichonephila clavipes]
MGIREAEDWFRPIDLAKECDIYISSKNGITFSSGLDEKRKKGRTAADSVQSGAGRLWQPKPSSLRAQAQ